MMPLDTSNPKPLFRQLADKIKEEIESSVLKPGDKIPSQNQLSDLYQVSLITVKKALAELNREGYIIGRIGMGSFVAERRSVTAETTVKTIGFLLRDLSSPFFSKILSGAEKRINEQNYSLVLASTAGETWQEENQIGQFMKLGVKGIIIASMTREYCVSETIHRLGKSGFPYVFVSYIEDESEPYVGTDHESGAYMAATHMVRVGCRRIGYINGERQNILGALRKKGMLKALAVSGLSFNPDHEFFLELRGEWNDYESGYKIGKQIARLAEKPDGLFCYNDLAALGCQKALLEAGVRIPEDLAMVGFDDIKRGVTAPVPLTTIQQPTELIGRNAVDLIISQINGQPFSRRQILEPKLIIRESCGYRNRV